MPNLDGQVILVTGSTQGVGEAIALESARLGADAVVVCGRNAENGRKVVSDIEAIGSQSLFVEADLADVQATRAIVAECDEWSGGIAGRPDAAARTPRGNLACTGGELWAYHSAVNVRASILVT